MEYGFYSETNGTKRYELCDTNYNTEVKITRRSSCKIPKGNEKEIGVVLNVSAVVIPTIRSKK